MSSSASPARPPPSPTARPEGPYPAAATWGHDVSSPYTSGAAPTRSAWRTVPTPPRPQAPPAYPVQTPAFPVQTGGYYYPRQPAEPFVAVNPFVTKKASRWRTGFKGGDQTDPDVGPSVHTSPHWNLAATQPLSADYPRPGSYYPRPQWQTLPQQPIIIQQARSGSSVSRSRSRSPQRHYMSRPQVVVVRRSRSSSRSLRRSRSPRAIVIEGPGRSRSRSPRSRPGVAASTRSRRRHSRSRSPAVVIVRGRSRSRSYSPRGRGRRSPSSSPHNSFHPGSDRPTRSHRSRSPRRPRHSRSPSPNAIPPRSSSYHSRRSRSPSRSSVRNSPSPPIPEEEGAHSKSSLASEVVHTDASSHSNDSHEFLSDSLHSVVEDLPGSPIPDAVPYTMGPIPTPMEESSTYSSVYRRSRPGTLPLPATSSAPSKKLTLTSTLNTITTITIFLALLLIDELPRQAYLHLLLRIPSLYFSRVTRIFEEARLSLPDIKRMARSRVEEWDDKQNPNQMPSFLFGHPDRGPLPRSLLNFKTSWDSFIDSLMREWKTLNVISVLLMSAILTLLQIENASHPIIRTTALFSLICSLMSLLYGCIYIIRFGTMRKMHKASSFATDAQRNVGFWWNVWVMLAMPAIWLSWSIITFLASIMSFIWLSGTSADSADVVLSDGAALGVRIGLTFVLAVGLVYFVLIVREFHRYGDPLDQAWLRAVNQWAIEYPYPAPQPQPPTPPLGWTNPSNSYPYPHPNSRPAPSPRVPGSRNLADPFTHYTPARDLSSHSARPLRPRSWVSWQQPTHRPRSPSRQTDSSNRSRSPTYIVPPYTASHVDPDELYNELPADHRKTPSELPAGFSRTFIVPDNNTVPLTPVTVMRLGREENSSTFNSHALQRAHVPLSVVEAVPQEDWDRFLLDVSSAWRGDLALTQKAGGDVQSNDSPSYTVVQQQPPHLRPGAPSPPSLSPSPVVPSPSKVHTRTIADTANRVEGSDEENSPQRLSAVAEENGDDTVMPDHDRDVGETSSSRRTKSNAGTNTATKQSLSQSQSPTNVNFGEASIFSDTRSRTRTLSSERAQAQAVQDFINLWNERYFCARNLKARLVPTPALRLQDGLAPASDSDWRRRTEFVVVLSTPRQPAAAVGENSNQDARRMDNEQPLHTERTTSRSGSEAGGPSRSFTTADDNDNGDTIL